VDAVVATALAKSPDARYQTCRELVGASRAALGLDEPLRSRWLRARVLLGALVFALVATGLDERGC
jgi:hypothetical protein